MRSWPFEGRRHELATIRATFADPDVPALLLRAPAGFGKTRLAREAVDALDRHHAWVCGTRAARAIPLAAVATLPPEPAWAGREKSVLVVDDANLLDDASSAVIAGVVASGAAFALFTLRSGEPLADCLARLFKDDEAPVIDLPALSDAAIDRLIAHDTGGSIDRASHRRLRKGAWGNPLALRELLHGAVPGGLTELVAARLDGLDTATRRVVELVACGEPVPLAFLERLAGPKAVAAAEDSGLVVCERSDSRLHARLDHPLFGEVLRSRMAVARFRELHRALAGQLLATPMRRHGDTLLAALWQLEGGRIVRPGLVRDGAREAIGRAGLPLAERLARAYRDTVPGATADRLLAEILEYQGRGDEAAGLLVDEPPAQPAELLDWAIARSERLYWAGGDLAGADQALDAAGGHPTAEAQRAFMYFFAGRCEAAADAARRVLAHDDAEPRAAAWAAAAGTASLAFLGNPEQADAIRARGERLVARHAATLPWAWFQVGIGACLGALARGEAGTAAAIAADGYARASEQGVPMMVCGWALYGGIAATTRGDLALGDRLLSEAVTGFTAADTFRLLRCCLAAHAWVFALRGDGPRAKALMERADALGDRANEVFAPWIAGWRAWVSHADRDMRGAVAHARRAAELARAAGMPGVAALAAYDVLRLGGKPEQAPHGPEAVGTAMRAIAEGHGRRLADAAEAFARLGLWTHAAELAVTAVDAHRRTGHHGLAALAAARSAELRRHCPEVRTPLITMPDLGAALSVREREVALLAARYPSKEVATRLKIAVATVNNTLARVYAKLGINSRAQLRGLLGEDTGRG
ncbi:LuxR C-terminal-related transcriptional regulator [Phytomonospora endophytica]|uniref:DNA-binding CsgD family transcriptional regulator n=1 Tax=Phytomonospora endophytica TaxID=714109 RepID=A0A841FUC8_9ACTN|nr:LuxR C-terminal-related transcriptional regulator [Phytomonospora endophytica]MBB6038373.1 DNA-binding CsgD family transcriptional regulator [Phytomonospora endophytica]GIG64304.1 LuxR family transcriptional regulator [Phytomonospora endophytica]